MTKDEAIKWAGGKVIDLAAKLGIGHSAISQWERVPMLWQYRIEALSGGELTVDRAEQKRVGVRP